jgi:prolyl-tRNA synthetase
VRRVAGEKAPVPFGGVTEVVTAALDTDHAALYAEALAHRESHTSAVATIEEAAEAARTGWATLPWAAVDVEGEARLAESGVTVRCLTRDDGSVPDTEDEPGALAIVGRAY